MTDLEILEIEDRLVSRADALEALLKTGKQKTALSSLLDGIVEWRDAYHELLGEREEKEATEKENFEFLHARLMGYVSQFSNLGRGRQESVCRPFKASQVNSVLRPLKEMMEEATGVPLPLVSESEGHTYSDVSLLLCTYLGVSAAFAKRRFGLEYDVDGREVRMGYFGYGRRR